jgi:SAM-dependent methyltransferase
MKTEPGTSSPTSGELTLDEIMNRVRSELRHRRQELAASAMQAGDLAMDDDDSLRWEAPSKRLELKQAYTLAELLQFADADFVEMAYRVLLRRPADAEGFRGRLAALRNGSASKVEILGDIRFSEEGLRRAVHVDGLLLPYKFSKWRRIPVIGRCMTLALSIFRLPRMGRSLQAVEAVAARETQRLGSLFNRLDKSNEDRFAGLEAALDKLTSFEDQQTLRMDAMRGELQSELEELRRHRDSIESLRLKLSDVQEYSDARYAELKAAANDNRRGMLDIQRRLMAFLDGAQATPVAANALPAVDTGLGDILSAQYVSFEDTFRGTREDIKQRAAHYLTMLDSTDIKQTNGLVLDLGCGRGEWLEVLGEQGYRSRGIDLNRVMVEEARERGFEAVEADALSHLRSLPDGSVSAITSMHLVEHLPYETLIRLLDESMRVLCPGGLLFLETPNPENLAVGACWFYMDPSHRNPIPPALLQWLVRDRGFAQAEIQRLSENRGLQHMELLSDDVPGAKQINELIGMVTAPPDYAVVAVRP